MSDEPDQMRNGPDWDEELAYLYWWESVSLEERVDFTLSIICESRRRGRPVEPARLRPRLRQALLEWLGRPDADKRGPTDTP